MVRRRRTASRQLSRTPWPPRRRRKIWRARRIKAAHSSTGCFESSSKKLRQPCGDGSCWKEPPINSRLPARPLPTLPWTPTTVRWRRSRAPSEKHFGRPPASPAHARSALSSAVAEQNSLFCAWFINKSFILWRRLCPHHDLQRASPIDGLGRSTPTQRPNRRLRRSHGVRGKCRVLESAIAFSVLV